ncbi:MAG: GAF domain-containing protein [Lachnospiraceae bacterium]|nr:GAF domain-containing protein [Lachnospiraceae bacterium]
MKNVNYSLLCRQLEGFMETEPYWLPVLSNAAALLYEALPSVNWAGFYVADARKAGDGGKRSEEESLVLGPFQGKTACIRIPKGKGVCGTAWKEDRVLCVPDVHAFPGHIACDSASRSEIVLPLHTPDGAVFGVLDIDSPVPERFCDADCDGLKQFAKVLEAGIDCGGIGT